jgi:hypothetical protein
MAVPKCSKLNTFQCRHAIALLVLQTKAPQKALQHVQSLLQLLRPTDIATKMRYNTIVWMINILFSEKFLRAYLQSNDSKSRGDIETGVGGTMGRFWSLLSDEMTNNNEDITNSATEVQVDIDDEMSNSAVQVDKNLVTVDPYKLIFAESINNITFQQRVEAAALDPSDFTVTTGIVLSA